VVEHTKLIGEEMAKKLKTGQIYTMTRDDGSVEEFICWATLDRRGTRSGWIQRFGFARQMVSEDSEFVAQIEAVAPPEAKAPVVRRSAVKKTTPARSSIKKATAKARG